MEEEMPAEGDDQAKRKQMTHLSVTEALADYIQYYRKSEEWMEITDVGTRWWRRASTRKLENNSSKDKNNFNFSFYVCYSILQLLISYKVK